MVGICNHQNFNVSTANVKKRWKALLTGPFTVSNVNYKRSIGGEMAAFPCRRESFRSLQQIVGQAIALKPAAISIFYYAAVISAAGDGCV
jgi:hypothetical protein